MDLKEFGPDNNSFDSPPKNIEDLHNEILSRILCELTIDDRVRCERVNRTREIFWCGKRTTVAIVTL